LDSLNKGTKSSLHWGIAEYNWITAKKILRIFQVFFTVTAPIIAALEPSITLKTEFSEVRARRCLEGPCMTALQVQPLPMG
jgi:hypothetical protein